MTTPWTPPSAATWNPLDLYKRQEQTTPLTVTEGDDNKTNSENALNWLGSRVMQYSYIAGLSVVANIGAAAGNVSVLTATGADQVLKVNSAGNGLEFGLMTGLPPQAGNTGKWLQTDGTNAHWHAIPTDTYVPYTGANANVDLGPNSLTAFNLYALNQTPNSIAYIDGSNRVSSLPFSTYPNLTELGYVKGVTSHIQTQFSGKQALLTGTGFVKSTAGVISYDTNTYLTTISGIAAGGELSGTYANPSLLNSAVIGKVLTGLNLGSGGSISATDTILQAFGKIQNNISAMLGGVLYKDVWNASTNTPTIPVASASNKGWYYIVNVAGSTNIGGITDWKVGDWVISNGSSWSKVDNTDAVSSVNGFTGAVNLTTADVSEVTNLYYTDARVRLALSSTATGLTYTNTTGVFSLTAGYVIPTTTDQTNWNTAFADRNKWDGGATGLVAATGRTSLGATTVGGNIFTSTNPSAITFLRANADNSVSWLDAATFRTAIGTVGGSISSTQIAFGSGTGTIAGSANFVWDNTNSRLGIGTTPVFSIDVLVNAATNGARIRIKNSNSAADSQMAVFNNVDSWAAFFKTGSTYATYKSIKANDLGFYNNISGDIVLLNDVATGKVLMSAGGVGTAQVSLLTNGRLLIGTLSDNGAGILQVAGNAVPEANNTRTLGDASFRWSTIYGVNANFSGTITSGTWNGTAIADTYIASSTNWNTAFTQTRQWDGGATGLVAATGRTSLGATTVGSNLFTLANPSAITFLRINADNSVSTLDATSFRSAIGSIGGSGTTNYIPKFSAASTFGNSLIYDTGTTIGIGTNTPTNKLDIDGGTVGNQGIAIWGYRGNNTGDKGDIIFKQTIGGGAAESWIAQIQATTAGSSATQRLDFKMGAWNNASTVSTVMSLIGTGNVAFTGTIIQGIWNGTAIAATFGGTAQTSWTTGDLLYASGTNTLAKRAIGSTGQILTVSGGVPVWANAPTAYTIGNGLTNSSGTINLGNTLTANVLFTTGSFTYSINKDANNTFVYNGGLTLTGNAYIQSITKSTSSTATASILVQNNLSDGFILGANGSALSSGSEPFQLPSNVFVQFAQAAGNGVINFGTTLQFWKGLSAATKVMEFDSNGVVRFTHASRGVVLPKLSADPGSGEDGEMYFNTTSKTYRAYTSGSGTWKTVDLI